DLPSARVLEFAIRRLRDVPIGILVTARAEEIDPLPLGLDRALPAARSDRLAPPGPASPPPRRADPPTARRADHPGRDPRSAERAALDPSASVGPPGDRRHGGREP